MARTLQNPQKIIGTSLMGTLERYLLKDVEKKAEKENLAWNSSALRIYQGDVQTMLSGVDTKYARALVALSEGADVTEFVNIKEGDAFSRYLKGETDLLQFFTALKNNEAEVYSEDAERAYFQVSGWATYGLKPSPNLVAEFERERIQKCFAVKKTAYKERMSAYDEAATEKKKVLKRKQAESKALVSRYKKSGDKAFNKQCKETEKENKKLLKFLEKENKLQRKIEDIRAKKDLGLAFSKDDKKLAKLEKSLREEREKKEQFKTKALQKLQIKDRYDLLFKTRRAEQLALDDYSYFVVRGPLSEAMKTGQLPANLMGRNLDERGIEDHYEAQHDVFRREEDKGAEYDASRSAQMDFIRITRFYEDAQAGMRDREVAAERTTLTAVLEENGVETEREEEPMKATEETQEKKKEIDVPSLE